MKTKAFLFDMDGLLLDTEWLHICAYMEMTKRLGKPQEAETLKRFIGHSNLITCQWLIDELGCAGTRDELIAEEFRIYCEILEEKRPEPFRGVRELFAFGDARGFHRALVSSSFRHMVDPTMKILADHIERPGHWHEHFHVICTGDRVERLKPAPDIYLLAMKELNVSPDECVAFEDSPAGVTAAHTAGCRVVAIPNMYLKAGSVPHDRTHFVFESLHEAFLNIEKVIY